MASKGQEFEEEIERAKTDTEYLKTLIGYADPVQKKMVLRETAIQVLMSLAEDDPKYIQVYLDDFYDYLSSKNAFSKFVSLYCICGLVLADLEPQFDSRITKYLSMLHDCSGMIPSHCALNCGKIAAAKTKFEPAITEAFLGIIDSDHTENRQNLVIAYVINAFSEFAEQSERLDEITAFVWGQMENASPKAREASKNYMAKFQGNLD